MLGVPARQFVLPPITRNKDGTLGASPFRHQWHATHSLPHAAIDNVLGPKFSDMYSIEDEGKEEEVRGRGRG